jgi:hypothetical protein
MTPPRVVHAGARPTGRAVYGAECSARLVELLADGSTHSIHNANKMSPPQHQFHQSLSSRATLASSERVSRMTVSSASRPNLPAYKPCACSRRSES